MPIGPKGEKRPASSIASANMVARIATGLQEEVYVDTAKREAGKKGGKARAESLSEDERAKIAKKGAKKRWG